MGGKSEKSEIMSVKKLGPGLLFIYLFTLSLVCSLAEHRLNGGINGGGVGAKNSKRNKIRLKHEKLPRASYGRLVHSCSAG